jgi:transcriptional regulator with XRE-family HTH domain
MTITNVRNTHISAAPAPAAARSALRAGQPIVRHQFGAQLRELRQARSLRLEDVAGRLGIAPSTLSRIETGKAPTRIAYLLALLNLYDVEDSAQRALLVQLAHEAQRTPWLADYYDLLPAGTYQYLSLEASACRIRSYSPITVPDLLRTPGYADAACRAEQPDLRTDEVRKLVALQQHRHQAVLADECRLEVVIDEVALLRPIAPADVMAGQLEFLLAATANPAVSLQVVPMSPDQPVLSPPFVLLDFNHQIQPAAFSHGPAGQMSTTKRAKEVQTTVDLFEALARIALLQDDSGSRIEAIARR